MSTHIEMSIINDFSELQNIHKEWDDLFYTSSNNMIFQSYLWNYEVGKSFSREREMLVFCFRKNERLIGVIPLRLIKRNFIVFKYNIINFFTHNRADCQDILIGEDITQCLTLLTDYIDTNNIAWNTIYLRNIPKNRPTSKELINNFKKQNILSYMSNGIVCPIILANESYEQYQSRLKSKMRSELRRHEKRLREKGEVSIIHYSGEVSIETICRYFIELHIKRWSKTETPSKFNKNDHCDYYLSLFRELYKNNLLDIYYLKFNNKIIAFHFGTNFANHELCHTSSYDPEYSRYGPSKILLSHVINQCFINNMHSINLLAGAENYKSDWTVDQDETINVYAFSNNFSKLIYDLFFNKDKFRILSKFKKTI